MISDQIIDGIVLTTEFKSLTEEANEHGTNDMMIFCISISNAGCAPINSRYSESEEAEREGD